MWIAASMEDVHVFLVRPGKQDCSDLKKIQLECSSKQIFKSRSLGILMGLLWTAFGFILSWRVLMYCPTVVELYTLLRAVDTKSKEEVLNSACPERDGEEFCRGSTSADPRGRGSVTWAWE